MLTEITEAAKRGQVVIVGDLSTHIQTRLMLHWDELWRKTFWKQ